MYDETTKQRLAHRFSGTLRSWLTEAQMDEIVEANANEESRLVCHSHDHCDANEAMASAFVEVTGKHVDPMNDEQRELWNAAWDLAIEQKFSWN